jgi:hypothetical protein
MRAMVALEREVPEWVNSMPTELRDLIERVKALVTPVPPPLPSQITQHAIAEL